MPARANAFALATTRSSRVLQPDRETTSRHGTSHAHDALCNTPRTLIFFAAGLPTGRIAELNRQDMAAIFTGSVRSPPHRSRNTHSTLTSLPHRTARMRSSRNMGRNGSLPLFFSVTAICSSTNRNRVRERVHSPGQVTHDCSLGYHTPLLYNTPFNNQSR